MTVRIRHLACLFWMVNFLLSVYIVSFHKEQLFVKNQDLKTKIVQKLARKQLLFMFLECSMNKCISIRRQNI